MAVAASCTFFRLECLSNDTYERVFAVERKRCIGSEFTFSYVNCEEIKEQPATKLNTTTFRVSLRFSPEQNCPQHLLHNLYLL